MNTSLSKSNFFKLFSIENFFFTNLVRTDKTRFTNFCWNYFFIVNSFWPMFVNSKHQLGKNLGAELSRAPVAATPAAADAAAGPPTTK